MTDRTSLGHWVRRFLQDYAASERNLSPNTRTSYRDMLVQLLPFVAKSKGAAVDKLAVTDLSATIVRAFLAHLEKERRCSIATRRLALRTRFDRIFCRRTDFVSLDRLLARLHANKAELLTVLDHPATPLNTNDSENDIRCQVTCRRVSAGTPSDLGRDYSDAFLGLSKTCTKLGIAFWDYLGSRLRVAGQHLIPPLPDLVRSRSQPA